MQFIWTAAIGGLVGGGVGAEEKDLPKKLSAKFHFRSPLATRRNLPIAVVVLLLLGHPAPACSTEVLPTTTTAAAQEPKRTVNRNFSVCAIFYFAFE